jgi:hypothetical protein
MGRNANAVAKYDEGKPAGVILKRNLLMLSGVASMGLSGGIATFAFGAGAFTFVDAATENKLVSSVLISSNVDKLTAEQISDFVNVIMGVKAGAESLKTIGLAVLKAKGVGDVLPSVGQMTAETIINQYNPEVTLKPTTDNNENNTNRSGIRYCYGTDKDC